MRPKFYSCACGCPVLARRRRVEAAVACVLFAVIVLFSSCARSQEKEPEVRLTPEQCEQLSQVAQQAAWLHSLDADQERFIVDTHRKNRDLPRALWSVVVQEIEAAFRGNQPYEDAGAEVLARCKANDGLMGLAV